MLQKAIIGKKVGMTQIFNADGKVIPCAPEDGTQIISNNFIDDMDKGNYMTLAPAEDGGSEAQGN